MVVEAIRRRTPDEIPSLTQSEQDALVAFLRTLTSSHVDALVSDARSVTIGERAAGGQ